jgi:GT2 family glycosyltransferase
MISLVVLTYNRARTVERAMTHNLAKAGHPIDELIWVDNGSRDGVREVMQQFKPDVTVLHKTNLGVAKGYNHGFVLATHNWIALTGCDMLMPENWLFKMVHYTNVIPETDVVCMYSGPFSWMTERLRGPMQERGGLQYQPAMPLGRRLMRREVLKKAGYFREDFGLYGWEDVEWADRCLHRGLFCYVIPGEIAEHLSTEGVAMEEGHDPKEYFDFKKREALLTPEKRAVMDKCRAGGFPFYSPYM